MAVQVGSKMAPAVVNLAHQWATAKYINYHQMIVHCPQSTVRDNLNANA